MPRDAVQVIKRNEVLTRASTWMDPMPDPKGHTLPRSVRLWGEWGMAPLGYFLG